MRNLSFAKSIFVLFALFSVGLSALPVFAQDDEGEIIASIGFDPKVNGFGFRNFGKNPDFDEDLTEDDLIRMFGAANVCIEGTTAADCVLYETADRWREEAIEKMNGGHCDGFSVSSLRMFLGRPFKGRKNPAAFQQGAVNLFDLRKTQLTSNYVSYFQTLTFLKETWQWRTPIFKKKPSEILEMIEEAMKTKKEYYTLEVWMRESGKLTRGHSILPIAIEEMDEDGIYRIHVYDNNYPGQTKYVVINTNKETWRYHTANNPAETARDYVGSATTNTLALKRLSDRARSRYECPFCDEDTGDTGYESSMARPGFVSNSFASPFVQRTGANVLIGASGDVDMLIEEGGSLRRLGYDPEKEVSFNEIPGASENVIPGNGEEDNAPEYSIPVNPANKNPYTITLGGTDSEEQADVQVYGPGFVVGFDDISLDKGEKLKMRVSPNGRELSFTASADGETPSLYIATDAGDNKPSYEFEIGGIALAAGKTVTLKLDIEKGLLYFKDDDGDEDKYDVVISKTNPNGKVQVFEDYDMDIGDKNVYVLNFGAWDGKSPICVKDDEDGDGFDDEECTNEADDKPSE